MKKLIWGVGVVLLLFSTPLFADVFNDYNTYPSIEISYQNEANNSVSVTSTATTVTFSKDTKAIWIDNEGSNEVYVNLFGTTATTADSKINAGENRGWNGFQTRAISLVCDTAETTTVNVEAIY